MEDRTRFTIWIAEPRVVADGGVYSVYCDELGIASSGVTEIEAKKNLEYAIISYCGSLEKAGFLEKRLEKNRHKVRTCPENPPNTIVDETNKPEVT